MNFFRSLLEQKARDWKEIGWKSLAENFKGVTPQFLWYLMKTTLRCVPENHHENLNCNYLYFKNICW